MIKFLREAMSEGGTASIKRVTLVVLLFAFLAECVVNLVWNKLLSDVLRDQLYYAMISCLGVIFGINILQGVKEIKIAQSNNNAQVGAPSPAPDTTIVTKS